MAKPLTDERPTSPARRGAIVLARHGEPALSRNVKLNADGYRTFWASYELMGLVPGQTPPDHLVEVCAGAGTLMSSTRLRAIESAEAVAPNRAFDRLPLLIEAPLPPPNWPSWVRLSPKMWGFWSRFCWWYFNHHAGQENRAQAEARADRAVDMLIEQAAGGQDVVVLAHGFFNFMMSRALRRRGWKQVWSEGYKYWSTRRFEQPNCPDV